ncbi:MAG: DUF6624 domain-containing protein [Nonlabens sp.]|uniref:DUF6624 domain-containing protein n=1 Tax=Nonlabens sp. TaxID=1888209 RepID=UPI003EFADA7B
MKFPEIAEKIIDLEEADLKLRNELLKKGILEDGYNEEMELLHNKNVQILNDIISQIGYPTVDQVGEKASNSAWLVIQHGISQPAFMKKCLGLLEVAVAAGKANPMNLAYLADRIAVFEERPQLYGTQFDWDEHGALSPLEMDDVVHVNARRLELGLNTVEAQTKAMRDQAFKEKRTSPANYKNRKIKYDAWKKKVGWLN